MLSRVLLAAKKYNAEIIIRVTSDCPLIDLDIIYQCYQLYVNIILIMFRVVLKNFSTRHGC